MYNINSIKYNTYADNSIITCSDYNNPYYSNPYYNPYYVSYNSLMLTNPTIDSNENSNESLKINIKKSQIKFNFKL